MGISTKWEARKMWDERVKAKEWEWEMAESERDLRKRVQMRE